MSSLLYFESVNVKSSITHAVVLVLFLIFLAIFLNSNLKDDPQNEYQELLTRNDVLTLDGTAGEISKLIISKVFSSFFFFRFPMKAYHVTDIGFTRD